MAREVSLTRVMTSFAHGRQNPLDDLQQRDPEEDLGAGHAQDLAGLGLAAGHALDAAAVDLGEIAGIVDDKGHHRGGQAAAAAGGPGVAPVHQARAQVDDNDLQHQGGAADHPHKGAHHIAQRRKPAHGAKRHQKAQRQRKDQRQRKKLGVEQKALGQAAPNHHGFTHVIPLPCRACRRLVLFRNKAARAPLQKQARGSAGMLRSGISQPVPGCTCPPEPAWCRRRAVRRRHRSRRRRCHCPCGKRRRTPPRSARP